MPFGLATCNGGLDHAACQWHVRAGMDRSGLSAAQVLYILHTVRGMCVIFRGPGKFDQKTLVSPGNLPISLHFNQHHHRIKPFIFIRTASETTSYAN